MRPAHWMRRRVAALTLALSLGTLLAGPSPSAAATHAPTSEAERARINEWRMQRRTRSPATAAG